jgi:hypothetical protein
MLLDHLVGEREQRRRHCEADYPGRLGVDDEFELGRTNRRRTFLWPVVVVLPRSSIGSRNLCSNGPCQRDWFTQRLASRVGLREWLPG